MNVSAGQYRAGSRLCTTVNPDAPLLLSCSRGHRFTDCRQNCLLAHWTWLLPLYWVYWAVSDRQKLCNAARVLKRNDEEADFLLCKLSVLNYLRAQWIIIFSIKILHVNRQAKPRFWGNLWHCNYQFKSVLSITWHGIISWLFVVCVRITLLTLNVQCKSRILSIMKLVTFPFAADFFFWILVSRYPVLISKIDI